VVVLEHAAEPFPALDLSSDGIGQCPVLTDEIKWLR